MTRRNALLRLHENLLAYRERQCRKLAAELAYLHDGRAGVATGDSADLAFEVDGDEISSRLSEFGDRELIQIERALARCQQGSYGICEGCRKPISLARLNALPYTPCCIICERAMEKHCGRMGRQGTSSWGHISDAQAPMRDERIDLSELERELSGSRHR